MSIECSTFQIDLAPSLDPSVGILLNLTPDHLDRTGHGNYAAIKQRLVEAADFAIVGRDDDWCEAIFQDLEAPARPVVGIAEAGRMRSASVCYESGRLRRASPCRRCRRWTRTCSISPAPRPCAAPTTVRTRRPRSPPASGSAWPTTRSGWACAPFPASPIAWSRSAARARCCSSTTARPPTPTPPKRRCSASANLLDSRRQGQGGRHRAAAAAVRPGRARPI